MLKLRYIIPEFDSVSLAQNHIYADWQKLQKRKLALKFGYLSYKLLLNMTP